MQIDAVSLVLFVEMTDTGNEWEHGGSAASRLSVCLYRGYGTDFQVMKRAFTGTWRCAQ